MRDHVDLPRLDALNKYWTDHPPVHVLVAGFVGFKSAPAQEFGDLEALMMQTPQTPKA